MGVDPRIVDGPVAQITASYETAILGTWGTSGARVLDAEPVKLGVSSVVCTSYFLYRNKSNASTLLT